MSEAAEEAADILVLNTIGGDNVGGILARLSHDPEFSVEEASDVPSFKHAEHPAHVVSS